MAFNTKILHNGVLAVTNGTAFENTQLNNLFQVTIAGTATVKIYGSLDNSNFQEIASLTATGNYHSQEKPWAYFRADVTAWTSGAVTVVHAN